jgi:hypothetical protein
MKLRYWIFGLIILTQVASSGCMLFSRRNDCCGERRGLFSFLTKRRHTQGGVLMSGGMDCGAPCTAWGDAPAFPVSGGPMFAGPPDERLGAPAVNRPWDGQGAPPATPLPKSNPPPSR